MFEGGSWQVFEDVEDRRVAAGRGKDGRAKLLAKA